MGFFWTEYSVKVEPSNCSNSSSKNLNENCPISRAEDQNICPYKKQEEINPLNKMPKDLPQTMAYNQKKLLPTRRTLSSIPRNDINENWEYPSPQQMYHAILRKGQKDVSEDAVEPMVEIHNFLNESAWNEIKKWEERRGCYNPKLSHFKGRASDYTPKSLILYYIGKIYPSKFGSSLPFDRHDWYVSRNGKIVRYVIDYYDAPLEPSGEVAFYLDVRPAIDTPGAVYDRISAWTSKTWARLFENSGNLHS
ncbi:hypothetical protein T552_00071 [Pneumocystis carinii B80]|uniref:Holocytochrome c-type synthase n=1 Tax=Pneumocystis carinii (strain B80) TaxID=1408658 RepID=A0A0W4ZSS8_PNEC8|nr:hypothetical protein T552_00071 [Pneumocystis carinii B80]KTW31427.1 hypothetical protein T552_00071 [Pneumocystis carinii B80]